MAKRQPSETICSFCLKTILDKDAYSVKLKMYKSEEIQEGNIYYTPSCDKCLDSDRIIEIHKPPKNNKK